MLERCGTSNISINQINQSNFYSANIPCEAKLSGDAFLLNIPQKNTSNIQVCGVNLDGYDTTPHITTCFTCAGVVSYPSKFNADTWIFDVFLLWNCLIEKHCCTICPFFHTFIYMYLFIYLLAVSDKVVREVANKATVLNVRHVMPLLSDFDTSHEDLSTS